MSEFQIRFIVHKGEVVMSFPEAYSWISLPAPLARKLHELGKLSSRGPARPNAPENTRDHASPEGIDGHQERVAVARNRPVDNKWIGQRIADPDIDMAMVARGQGAKGFGPCRTAGELEKARTEAVAVVEAGGVAVVDARILGGYSPATAAAMSRGKADRGT